jgi:hypothetical protein
MGWVWEGGVPLPNGVWGKAPTTVLLAETTKNQPSLKETPEQIHQAHYTIHYL